MKFFPPWQSLTIAVGGGALLALFDVLSAASTLTLYIAAIIGAVTAASVFKYGHLKGEEEFSKVTLYAIALCVISNGWCEIDSRSLWGLTKCRAWLQ